MSDVGARRVIDADSHLMETPRFLVDHAEAMAAFCAADPRLLGVALGDLDDPQRSLAELDAALELGPREGVWIPAGAPGGRAPGHPDHDRYWARLAEHGVPFVLHVGSGPLPIGDEWMEDGRPPSSAARRGRPRPLGPLRALAGRHGRGRPRRVLRR